MSEACQKVRARLDTSHCRRARDRQIAMMASPISLPPTARAAVAHDVARVVARRARSRSRRCSRTRRTTRRARTAPRPSARCTTTPPSRRGSSSRASTTRCRRRSAARSRRSRARARRRPTSCCPRPTVLAASADNVLRCPDGAGDSSRFYFRIDFRDGSLATAGAPVSPAMRAWLADSITSARAHRLSTRLELRRRARRPAGERRRDRVFGEVRRAQRADRGLRHS